MTLPGRTSTGIDYRYGFQGQEKDDELKGEGNSYDFGARMFDTRIGRFFTRDPKWREYLFQSPYAYALNNPIRFIDLFGEGPGDRVKAAQKFKNTPYKQQTELELRTGTSKKALEFMDCSELICRVLAADEFTDGVKNMPTSNNALQSWLNSNGWEEVDAPKKGDIIVWKGHTALVTADYEEGKKINVIHATKYGSVSSVVEEKYKMSYYDKKGAKFYRPKVDKPDGDLDYGSDYVFFDIEPLKRKFDYQKEIMENLMNNINETLNCMEEEAERIRQDEENEKKEKKENDVNEDNNINEPSDEG